jgi:outer membrane protein assembly factor BamB
MKHSAAVLVLGALAPLAASAPDPADGGWPQFGGPSRDFCVQAPGLVPWGDAGPTRLWQRDLGDGYSGIVAGDGVLYTMYTPSAWLGLANADAEAVIAIDADTGATLWEQRDPVETKPAMRMEHGPGPHSTPLLAGGRLFTAGVTGRLQALDPKTGEVLWARELWDELGGKVMDRGYSCSPLAWRDTVVVAVGGSGPGLVAFDQKDGSIRWKSPGFDASPSSPILIDVDGQEQIVYFASAEVIGFEAATGRRLWSVPHETTYRLNIAMPVVGDDGLLVVSSAYSGGTRALRLSREGDSTSAEELWFTNQMRVHHGNFILTGGYMYGSSGDFGPTPLSALDLRTGEIVWRDRAFAKAKLVHADGRVVLLDEDGSLGMVVVTPEGLDVLARAQVFDGRSWTAPTPVGTRLYLRDRKEMVALDLSGGTP